MHFTDFGLDIGQLVWGRHSEGPS